MTLRVPIIAVLMAGLASPAVADPVSIVALVGSIAGAAAASSPGIIAAIGAIGAAVLGAVISVGAGLAAQLLLGSRNQNTGGQREERTRAFDPHPPIRFAFGEFPLEGSVVFHASRGQVYYITLLLNSVASDSISSIEINEGIELEFNLLSGSDIYDMDSGATCTGPAVFSGAVKMWIGLGEQSSPPSQWVEEIGDIIGESDIWSGATVVHVRIEHGKEKQAVRRWTHGKPPPLRFLGRWSKVYDPRLDSSSGVTGAAGSQDRDDPTTWAWSDSPALCGLMLARHEFALGFDDEMIPIQQWAEAADGVGPAALGREKTFVIGSTFGEIQALGVLSGEERWSYDRSGSSAARGMAFDAAKNVYAAWEDGALHKINPSGEAEWTVEGAHAAAVTSVVLGADGRVYTSGLDGYLRAWDAASGYMEWEYDAGIGIGALSLDADHAFLLTHPGSGAYLRVRKVEIDGAQVWEHVLGSFGVDLGADGGGGVYVRTGNTGPLRHLTSAGTEDWTAGPWDSSLWGAMTVDVEGTAWVSDGYVIRRYSVTGALMTSFAHAGAGVRLQAMERDGDGDLWVATDSAGHRYTTDGALVQSFGDTFSGDVNGLALSTGADATGWFGCDGVVVIEERELSLLDPVLACMAGHLDTTDGLLGVRAGVWSEPEGTLSQPVGEEIAVRGTRDAGFDAVRSKFIGEHRAWEETDGPGWAMRAGSRVHPLHLPLVKAPEQAARLEKVFALRAEPNRTVEAVWDGREANRRLGQRLNFALPGFGRATGSYVVDSKQVHLEPVEDGFRVEVGLTLVEDVEATYAWSAEDYVEPEGYTPPGIATPSIAPPTNLELATAYRTWALGEEGEPVPQIRVRFRPAPTEVDWYRVEVYEPPYTRGDENLGDRTWSIIVEPDATIDDGGITKLQHLIEPVVVGLTYTIKVWSGSWTLGESDTWLEGDITAGAPDSDLAVPVLVSSDHDGDHTATHTIRAPNSGAVRSIRLYVDDGAARSGLSLLLELFVGSLQAAEYADPLSYDGSTRYYRAVAVDRFGTEGDPLDFEYAAPSGATGRDYSADYSVDYG